MLHACVKTHGMQFPSLPFIALQDPVIFKHKPLDASTNITFYGLVGAPEWGQNLRQMHEWGTALLMFSK